MIIKYISAELDSNWPWHIYCVNRNDSHIPLCRTLKFHFGHCVTSGISCDGIILPRVHSLPLSKPNASAFSLKVHKVMYMYINKTYISTGPSSFEASYLKYFSAVPLCLQQICQHIWSDRPPVPQSPSSGLCHISYAECWPHSKICLWCPRSLQTSPDWLAYENSSAYFYHACSILPIICQDGSQGVVGSFEFIGMFQYLLPSHG